MNPVLAVLMLSGLGPLAAPAPPVPDVDSAVEIVLAGAQADFDSVVANVGLSGAAPLQGLEPALSPVADVPMSTGKVPAKRERRSATSSSTIRP